MERHPDLAANLHMPSMPGVAGRRMLAVVNEEKLRRILTRMLDEAEFYGPHGIRSLSRVHLDHPFVFRYGDQEFRVSYLPGDSDSGMFGGNSNWRGPVWMPVNHLLYVSLLRLAAYAGDSFKIEHPTGSGQMHNLFEVAHDLAERLIGTFLRDSTGRTTGLRRHGEIPDRSALARPPPLLRILPRRQRRGHRRQPSDRLDRPGRGDYPGERRNDRPDDGQRWRRRRGDESQRARTEEEGQAKKVAHLAPALKSQHEGAKTRGNTKNDLSQSVNSTHGLSRFDCGVGCCQDQPSA